MDVLNIKIKIKGKQEETKIKEEKMKIWKLIQMKIINIIYSTK